jgi:hypothetical protein
MPKKYFVTELAADIEIHVYIETFNGLVISYVVKLLLRDGKKYYEVIRFDSAHGCPHKDTIDEKGEVIRKTWFEFLDNQQGLDMSIKDIKDNFELYIERFKKWLQR